VRESAGVPLTLVMRTAFTGLAEVGQRHCPWGTGDSSCARAGFLAEARRAAWHCVQRRCQLGDSAFLHERELTAV